MNFVLDTNIVLDLFVFRDEAVRSLHDDLAAGKVQWLATPPMREELASVLLYEQLAARMRATDRVPAHALAAFDEYAQIVDPASPAPVTCRDSDDQKFIDLAVAHRAALLSRDKAVLALRRKLAPLQVAVAAAY